MWRLPATSGLCPSILEKQNFKAGTHLRGHPAPPALLGSTRSLRLGSGTGPEAARVVTLVPLSQRPVSHRITGTVMPEDRGLGEGGRPRVDRESISKVPWEVTVSAL